MLTLAGAPKRQDSERIALIHRDERWTWGDLDRRSAAWSVRLRGMGVRPDDLVAFAFPNGPDFFALVFGVYRVGADPGAALAETAGSGARSDSRADAADRIPQRGRLWRAPRRRRRGRGRHREELEGLHERRQHGRPKVIVDGRPAGFADGMQFIGIPERGRVFVPGPLYHNAPFSAAVFALWRGSTVVTVERFDAESALALIERERIEWAMMVPTMMHRLWRLPEASRRRHDLSRWRMVVHTAAPMAPWLKRAWIDWLGPDHIWEAYGATEGLVRTWIGGREWLERPGSVGRPTSGARLRILGTNGEDLPAMTEGEIFAMPPGGPGSSYRYIGAERRATPDGWESVGDVGHVDADGYLYLADRRADLIISGGVNIWPAEVEAALLLHPAIRSCAVVGLADEDLGQRVHAVVESDDPALDIDSLRLFLADRLSREKYPRSLNIQPTPVRDDAGKVRKPASIAMRTPQ